MKERIRKRLKEMTSIVGVSGYEWDVARYIKKELEGYVDSIEVMKNGMLIASKKGNKPGSKVLITAHMDEVGYVVKSISQDGFIYFSKVGIASEATIPGRKVWIKGDKGLVPGVIGTRSAHMLTPEEAAKPQAPSTRTRTPKPLVSERLKARKFPFHIKKMSSSSFG